MFRNLGQKLYELKDHVGSTRVIITDMKLATDDGTYIAGVKQNSTQDGIIDFYQADVVSATDYFVGGSPMPGRNFNANTYRYGAFGYEKDDEVKSSGNHYSFSDYGYDPRLMRRWRPDPLTAKLASWSPYVFALNNPINVIDEDGMWPKWIHNRIIKMAFKGVLTAEQIKILQKASLHTDVKPGAQTPENSPEHYMSKPGQDPNQAASESEKFIGNKKEEFKAKEGDDALFALGEGMHTIMDQTSPAHEGSQVWEGVNWKKPGTVFKALGHLAKEVNLFRKDEGKLKQAAENIKKYYEAAVQEKAAATTSEGGTPYEPGQEPSATPFGG